MFEQLLAEAMKTLKTMRIEPCFERARPDRRELMRRMVELEDFMERTDKEEPLLYNAFLAVGSILQNSNLSRVADKITIALIAKETTLALPEATRTSICSVVENIYKESESATKVVQRQLKINPIMELQLDQTPPSIHSAYTARRDKIVKIIGNTAPTNHLHVYLKDGSIESWALNGEAWDKEVVCGPIERE